MANRRNIDNRLLHVPSAAKRAISPVRRIWAVASVAAVLLGACSGGSREGEPASVPEQGRVGRAGQLSPGCEQGELPRGLGSGKSLLWASTCWQNPDQGSVALRDLNSDGVADVVVAALTNGDKAGIVALDGTDGGPLWQSESNIRMVTVTQFGDLNGDGTTDVIAGGRGQPDDDRPLVAIDGSDGSTIWRVGPIEPAWGNVYTPQSVGDVTGDGIEDWVVATGGDHLRGAFDEPTIAGRLVAVDGSDGTVMGSAAFPRLEETYNSPVVLDAHGGTRGILVGSGGEVFSGSLWRISLEDVLESKPGGFEEILPGEGQSSYMAPVSIGDLDADGSSDEAVAVRTDGLVTAMDPRTGTRRWEADPLAKSLEKMSPDTAVMSVAVPAIRQLDDDPQLEVVTQHALMKRDRLLTGAVTELDSVIAVLDGSTGEIEHELFVAGANSVQSPLIASTGNENGILCGCVVSGSAADRDDGTGSRHLGWWVPGVGEPEDLGLPASFSNTAAFDPETDAGAGHLLVSGVQDLIAVSRPRPRGRYVTEVIWGSYMGPDSTGHSRG